MFLDDSLEDYVLTVVSSFVLSQYTYVICDFWSAIRAKKIFDFRHRGNWSKHDSVQTVGARYCLVFLSLVSTGSYGCYGANKTMLPIISGISCLSADGESLGRILYLEHKAYKRFEKTAAASCVIF